MNHHLVLYGALSRGFVDKTGWLHQELPRVCSQATRGVAGVATLIKSLA